MPEQQLRRGVRRLDHIRGTSRAVVSLADRPRLVAVDGAFGADVRGQLLGLVDATVGGAHADGVTSLVRESTGLSFEWDPSTHAAGRALVDAMRSTFLLGDAAMTTLRIRRYREGEWHRLHGDHFVLHGLPLVATVIACLEAPAAGGETAFVLARPAPVAVPMVGGRMLAWANHLADGAPDHLSAHEGLLVRAGTKTTATWFVYADPARCPFVQGALDAAEVG